MTRRRWTAAAAALAAVLVAGCATTIAGNAVPNPVGLTSASPTPETSTGSTTSTSGSSTGSSDTSASTATSAESSTTAFPSSSDTDDPSSSTDSTTDTTATTSSATAATSGTSQPAYPTTPLKYNRTPSTQASANLLEARRIASALIVPTLIDPAYTRGGNISTLPLRGPAAMSVLFTDPVPSVAQRAGMITGFSSARSSTTGALLVAAFEFGTPAQATAAVPALSAASVNKESDKGKSVVPGYPAAAGQFGSTTTDGAYLQSFLAQGRMVLYVYVDDKKLTTAQLSALAAKTFKAQSSAFAAFKPTAPTALMQLLVDPDGMLAHTVPNSGDDATVRDGFMNGWGQLHYDSDPVNTRNLFASTGVDAVSDGRANVYRAKDATGAATVRDNFVASTRKSSSLQPYQLTAPVPGASCLQDALNSQYYCMGNRGRYAFEVSADSEADLNAAMNAEYQLLAGF